MRIIQICAYSAQYGGNFISSLKALEDDLVAKGHVVEYAFPSLANQYEWCKTIERRTKVYYCGINRFSF